VVQSCGVEDFKKEFIMTQKTHGLRELTDAEVELVSGGDCGVLHPLVLIQGNGVCNFNANAPCTPAADNGLQAPKQPGAFVGVCLD
jgi:hypothetical protein